jgi:hypothetical protein
MSKHKWCGPGLSSVSIRAGSQSLEIGASMTFDYLKESASRDPLGRLLVAVHKLGSNGRMSEVATEVDLSERDFVGAIAEAEWGGLILREQRADGGIDLVLTPQGNARAEAIVRPM